MRDKVYKYLKFIRFKDVVQWDLKRYLNNSVKSKYEVVALNKLINEESKKFDISDKKSHYGILGVNNQTGVFDAYIESGAKIKQKYKKMDTGWIAYNPYRVNVGSIGIKRSEHKYDYISPAYVVFSCKPSILPEYLYMTMKTPSFNKIIRDNTTGSVRQNLSFDVLKGLTVPLPSIEEQQSIVNAYNDRLSKAKRLEQNVKEVENSIEDYMLSELGIQPQGYPITESELPKASEPQVEYVVNHKQNVDAADTYLWGDEIKKEYKYLKFVRFKDLLEWGYDRLTGNIGKLLHSSIFPNKTLATQLEINPKTSFSMLHDNDDISFIPMECISDEYGEWKEKRTCKIASSKGYTKFKDGDLIWARITPCMQNGKSAVVDEMENGYGCGSTEFHVLRNHNVNLDLHYVQSLLRLPVVLKDAMKSFTGSAGQQRVPKSYLEKLTIPVPSMDIQNAIVEHINKQKSQIKELRQQAETLRNEALEAFEKEIFE